MLNFFNNKNFDELLIDAVKSENALKVKKLLKKGANPNLKVANANVINFSQEKLNFPSMAWCLVSKILAKYQNNFLA